MSEQAAQAVRPGWQGVTIWTLGIVLALVLALGWPIWLFAVALIVPFLACVPYYYRRLESRGRGRAMRAFKAFAITLLGLAAGVLFWSLVNGAALHSFTNYVINGKLFDVAEGSSAGLIISALIVAVILLWLLAALVFNSGRGLSVRAALKTMVWRSLVQGMAAFGFISFAIVANSAVPLMVAGNLPTEPWNLPVLQFLPLLFLTLLGGALAMAVSTAPARALPRSVMVPVIVLSLVGVAAGNANSTYVGAMSASNMVGMISGSFDFDDYVIEWYGKAHDRKLPAKEIADYLAAHAHWKTGEDVQAFIVKFPVPEPKNKKAKKPVKIKLFDEYLDDMVCSFRYEAAALGAADKAAAAKFKQDNAALEIKYCFKAKCRSAYTNIDSYGTMLFSSHTSNNMGWAGGPAHLARTARYEGKAERAASKADKEKDEEKQDKKKDYGPNSIAGAYWHGEIYGPGGFCTKDGRLAKEFQG